MLSEFDEWLSNHPTYVIYQMSDSTEESISLPDIALSSHKNYDKFWKIFDERLELCHKALQIRHHRIANITSDAAPILWQYGAFARLKAGESVKPLLYNNYSTLFS